MSFTSEQHFGSTLYFDITRSDYTDATSSMADQKTTRTFSKYSPNLSQSGYWQCVFEETKGHRSIDLQIILNWVSIVDSTARVTNESVDQDNNTSLEFISQIKSIRIHSGSTLSELLAAQLDGRCLLEGESIKVRLQPDRVLKNGRYKFRIGFYTKDIPNSRPPSSPLFTSLLEIDPKFDPSAYLESEQPDITFEFSPINPLDPHVTIRAHTSALKKSLYFKHRLTEVIEERTRKDSAFNGISCTITEFSPAVIRTMLRFLYTGGLRFKSNSNKSNCNNVFHLEGQTRHQDKVYFEDLFRVSERYEILELKELSLKAIQNTLNMSTAISILKKLPTHDIVPYDHVKD
ncbi:hypothetical protein BGZ76_000158 [Entomortierella beljakovae]|nr:hypothetical protein BGZ76_000158 [Entomortierella beljakovae]